MPTPRTLHPFFFAPLTLIALAAPANAQWLPNGNDIYFDTGHVGIGLGAPLSTAQLHVQSLTDTYGIFVTNNSYGRSTAYGVHARVPGSSAIALYGSAPSDEGRAFGVVGESGSRDGAAVFGRQSAKFAGVGVWGQTRGTAGIGVVGESRSLDLSNGFGVQGINYGGIGVQGLSYARVGSGVNGVATGTYGTGVYGYSTAKLSRGVFGRGEEYGVDGLAGGTQAVAGVRGTAYNAKSYGVVSIGDFGGTGAKYFIQPHPTDPSVNVRFVCLEGNESGTYFRGTMRMQGGSVEIPIPEDWQAVSEETGITVQVTPLRSFAHLTVWEKSRDRIVIAGTEDCEFDYFVNGVRRGFADYESRTANRAFRPEVRGVPFGAQYPAALRQILVQNGTLLPDYTPNEDTAARLGWELRDPADVLGEPPVRSPQEVR